MAAHDMRIARIAILLVAGPAAGVTVGVWTAAMTHLTTCRGFCNLFLENTFTFWQCALFGAGAAAVVLSAAAIFDGDIRGVVEP